MKKLRMAAFLLLALIASIDDFNFDQDGAQGDNQVVTYTW